ncbi:hypothetical protein MIND_00725600 [Mycena indigotica]|uniref:Glycerophosphocholine acyltransferase 1 n=1 Tax=Mycena indigotica TaxID=2126181 RepID=A0A8H6SMY7_9AGAR|nr:uncharacterized protein MIND_00725600 [Mycena indigotica]KAF7301601.1 hypothetical protein MIND_00725600 [Mycena indigotica]
MSDPPASISRPPSPPITLKNPFSASFERFRREEAADWAGAFTLLDTVETYFDSHVDLLQRKLQKHSDRLKKDLMSRAEEFKIKDFSGDQLAENFEREFKGFKIKLQARMTKLSTSWQSAKVVRTREKVSFFFGVMSLVFSALLFGLAPQWVHIAYTILGSYLLPYRAYTYKKKAWHYFLFDLCYYVNILNFIYLWGLPGSPALFTACYCLSHGSLASAVITWRNSLVFHDQDKVTSLFIHIYPAFTFTVIRHFYPGADQRFPALLELPHLNPLRALLLSGVIYLSWQLLYWKFVLVNRRTKIESGQRMTSFSFLLNDKRGAIGRSLSAIPPAYRLMVFMFGQLVYAVLTEAPAVYLLYDSPKASGAFLIIILGVSVWNGGGFYIEVFGRKFERELEALRKELAESNARLSSGRSSPTDITPALSRGPSSDALSALNDLSSPENSPPLMMNSKTLLPEDSSTSTLDMNGETKKNQ